MIDRTFQLISGVGPFREKDLWRRGVTTWSQLPRNEITLSAKLDPALHLAIAKAQAALDARDVGTMMDLLPSRTRWRFFETFAQDAAYLDIETDGTHDSAQITCVGVYFRGQVHAFVQGFNLGAFPAFARTLPLLVTFNGSCFDVPVLRRVFPNLCLPHAHLDARFVARHAGFEGGLKRIEGQLGLSRPQELVGVDGALAVTLWNAWANSRDKAALRKLITYNLYDVVQLQPLMERLVNRMRERELCGAPPIFESTPSEALAQSVLQTADSFF